MRRRVALVVVLALACNSKSEKPAANDDRATGTVSLPGAGSGSSIASTVGGSMSGSGEVERPKPVEPLDGTKEPPSAARIDPNGIEKQPERRRDPSGHVVLTTVTSSDADSGLTADAVLAKVRDAYMVAPTDCYLFQLGVDPKAHGRIELKITVAPTGKVITASATTTMAGTDLPSCFADWAGRWRFPAPIHDARFVLLWDASPD